MSKRSFGATYKPSGVSESKAAIIEHLMPTFKEMARAFNIDIIVDCRDGSSTEIREDIVEPETVNFHIDTFPSKFYRANTIMASSIFGLVPMRPIPLKTHLPSKNTMQYRLAKTELYSPETEPDSSKMQSVGCILGSHIFIYPDLLTSESWTNGNSTKLLTAISYWFLPRAIMSVSPSYETKIAEGLKILRSRYREMLPTNTDKNQFQEKFRTFIAGLNSKMLNGLEEEIQKAEKEQEKIAQLYFENLTKNTINRRRLAAIKSGLSSRDFNKEFEALLIMESIETVRVKEGRYLEIKTSPISQIPAREEGKEEEEKSYSIGEFLIKIDTQASSLTHSAIKFSQDGYTGPYVHAHIGTPLTVVCFGTSTETGLNAPIDNLMSKFDIVPLVHLIISFLKKEKTKPQIRVSWNSTATPREDKYKDEAEKEEEKQRFVKLVSDTILRSSSTQIEKEIADLNQKIDSNHDEILKLRKLQNNYQAVLEKLYSYLGDTDGINREAEYLLNDESIFNMILSEEELLICFNCSRIVLSEKEYLLQDFIMKITAGSLPKLLIQSSKRSLQSIPLIHPNKIETGELTPNDEIMVANLQGGHILEVLKIAKDKIAAGIFNPKIKVTEIKEEKDERSE